MVQMGEYFVFVINGKKVSQTRIEIGRSIKDMVIVTNGLKPGEQIVTEGVQKLRDNSPIVLTNHQIIILKKTDNGIILEIGSK